MPGILEPRAFISYRHTEHETGADADTLNRQHRAWVERFAGDLKANGVEAVYDGHIRDWFAPYTTKDPFQVAFLAELSTIGCLVCHAFIPVLTPSYIGRLGYRDYQRQSEAPHSFVHEEWQIGCFYCNHGVMQYIPIVRAGEPELMAGLPLGLGPENAFDMRDPADYPLQVQFIAERIHQAWDGDAPLITARLEDWLSLYVNWCRRNDPRCATAKVDSWSADLARPRLFLAEVLQRHGSGRSD